MRTTVQAWRLRFSCGHRRSRVSAACWSTPPSRWPDEPLNFTITPRFHFCVQRQTAIAFIQARQQLGRPAEQPLPQAHWIDRPPYENHRLVGTIVRRRSQRSPCPTRRTYCASVYPTQNRTRPVSLWHCHPWSPSVSALLSGHLNPSSGGAVYIYLILHHWESPVSRRRTSCTWSAPQKTGCHSPR